MMATQKLKILRIFGSYYGYMYIINRQFHQPNLFED